MEERKTIKLGEKEYYLDSLNQAAINALSDVNIINDEIKRHQLSINIANIAKGVFEKVIFDGIDKFEEVPVKETQEQENTKEKE